jgi:predicted component of type VI protein secretion system
MVAFQLDSELLCDYDPDHIVQRSRDELADLLRTRTLLYEIEEYVQINCIDRHIAWNATPGYWQT